MIEAEMKFNGDHKKLRSLLTDMDAINKGKEENIDVYFMHPVKDYRKTDEALRIRKIGDFMEITYKGPKINEESKSREEINIEVSDLGNAETFLKRLGFTVSGRVEKIREKWQLDTITITLDNVKNLGEYIELEMLVEDNVDHAVSRLKEIAERLGLDTNQQILSSYLTLIEEKIK